MGKNIDFVDSSKGLHSKMFISYSVVSCPIIKIQYFLMKMSNLDHNRHYKEQVGDTALFREPDVGLLKN